MPALFAVSVCTYSVTVEIPRFWMSSAVTETTGEAVAAAGLRLIVPVMTISRLSAAGAAGAGVASVVGVACAAAWFAASCCADESLLVVGAICA